jgi:hypothetical protein
MPASKCGFEADEACTKAYVVYSTGDTFQQSEDHASVIGVVETAEEANALVKAVWAHVGTHSSSALQLNGEDYYVAYYFGSVDEIAYENFGL